MRELVKSFRSKLHKLASAIDNNPMDENLYKEIEEFLEEQKSRSQSYLLNNADIEALKKLENFVSEGFEQTETNNITDLQEKFGLNPYRFPQGDTTSLVNATELSRDLYSRNPTDRENQDKQEKALEVSRLDKDSSEEGKSLPKSSYPIVNDVSSDVLDGGESEFGLTSRRERDETPEKEENK